MMINFIPKFLAQYKWNSIFFRYISIMLITFLIMLTITSSVVLHNVNITHTNNSNRLFDKIIVQAQNTVEKIENSVIVGTSSLVNDSNLILITNKKPDSSDFQDAFKAVNNMLTYMHVNNSYIASVYIYSAYNDYVYTMSASPVSSNSSKYFEDMDVFKAYEQSNQSPVFRKAILGSKSHTYFTYITKVFRYHNRYSYIVYNINLPQMFNMFNCPAHLIDENGEILYSSGGTIFNTKKALTDAKNSEVHFIDLSGGNFSVVLENPQTKIGISPWIYILLILFIVFVAFVLAYFIASALYKYIDKICQLVQTPFAQTENKAFENAEFNYITSRLKDLVFEHSKEDSELAKKLMQLNDIQATALQLQISPHFLFNTLNLISSLSLAEAKKDTKITLVVDLLSKMLNTILDTSNLVCPLDTEITYTKQYVEIQKFKYEDFDIVWKIHERDYNIPIVKFTLQPIIENAIHHGISSIENRTITITGNKDSSNKCYEIIVADNGRGITKEQEEKINAVISNESNPGTSIGLWNTNRRLKILLGEEYGCRIKSLKQGTAVIITLPLNN